MQSAVVSWPRQQPAGLIRKLDRVIIYLLSLCNMAAACYRMDMERKLGEYFE